MRCSECGFSLDPVNESQQVCPACGRDPMRCEEVEYGSGIAPALADLASLTDHFPLTFQGMEETRAVDSEVDYLSDAELELILADAEAYMKVLFESAILLTGNHRVN
jgi:hypothetical protein